MRRERAGGCLTIPAWLGWLAILALAASIYLNVTLTQPAPHCAAHEVAYWNTTGDKAAWVCTKIRDISR